MAELPIAAIKRIAKKSGAERIGNDAAEVLSKKAEAYIESLAKKAATLSDHAGRKTVKPEDIEMAMKYDPVETKGSDKIPAVREPATP